jgi:hypothetical protein
MEINVQEVYKGNKYKLVLIEWEDSQLGYQGWKFIEDIKTQVPVVLSVGFLIHEDEKCKVLYPHLQLEQDGEAKSGSGDILIPASAIKKVTEIPISSYFLSCPEEIGKFIREALVDELINYPT